MNIASVVGLQASRKLHGSTVFQGLNISIENRKGSVRKGVAKDGKPWTVKITYPYGYIKMTKGVDGDHVDCFVGPKADATMAYVIHTTEPTTGDYDEDKVMLGFDSAQDAKAAFLENYSSPKFFRSLHAIPMEEFKEKVLATKDEPIKLTAESQYGNTGWQYGRSIARSVGFQPKRATAGFPSAGKGAHHGVPKVARPKAATSWRGNTPKVKGPNVHKPNPSGHSAFNVRKPNLSLHHLEGEKVKIPKLKADIGGEPMTGNMGHAHIDPVVWFHPPSLLKRKSNESLRVPTDDPGETKDTFLDKTKRDSPDTAEFRNKLLKRSAPGGLPAQIPARTTLVSPHAGWYQPTGTGMYGAAERKARIRRNRNVERRGAFVSFKNKGRI
jgi:hypothetical protein